MLPLTLDPKINPLWTLHNCFIFGNITKNMSDASMSQFHFLDEGRETTIKNIGDKFSSCLVNHCKQFPQCESTISSSYIDANLIYDQFTSGQTLVQGICDNIPARITSDVGGIGVCNPHAIHQ